MKYTVAALCVSAVSAACDPADAPIIAVNFFTKEGCADADKVDQTKDATAKTAADSYKKTYNDVVKGVKACQATDADKKKTFGEKTIAMKHNDCDGGTVSLVGYTDDKCTTEAEFTDAQKKDATLLTWGECKKLDNKIDGKDYWIVYTGARELTAAVVAATLAVGAALY